MGTNLKMKSLTGHDANGDLVTFDIESQGYMRVHNGYVQYSYNNETWVNVIAVADLKGPAGSDASVTTDNIKTALGYVPAKQTVVDKLSEEIDDLKENGTGGGTTIIDGSSVYYVATDFGISTEAEDNTPALQTLVNTVYANGGGTIYFPIGTYNFKKADTKYAVLMKSNVSIVGENIEKTVLKQVEEVPYSMFYYMGTTDTPLTGATYSNFTIDAYATGNTNQVYGKAFFYQYVNDCVFRDLILKGTVATALGIDYLNRVLIENVNCIDCGRTYTGVETGTSGIGIGTGGWEDENFTINNCICVGCGQFGIFVENQKAQGWGGNTTVSRGQIISNCIVRNGLNNGIGIRGGQNLIISNCQVYDNNKHGLYIDVCADNVLISDCNISENGQNGVCIKTSQKAEKVILNNCIIDGNSHNGIYVKPTAEFQNCAIRNCTIMYNTGNGIEILYGVQWLCIQGNMTKNNAIGLYLGAYSMMSAIIKYNVFYDNFSNHATFTNIVDFNELNNMTGDSAATSKGETTTSGGEDSGDDNTGESGGDSGGDDSGNTGSGDTTNDTDTTTYTDTFSIENAKFIEDSYLNSSGESIVKENAGLSKYCDIEQFTANALKINIDSSWNATQGTRIAFYDSNKNLLSTNGYTRNEIYAEIPTNTKYFRIGITGIGTANCVISKSALISLDSSDFTAGTKLLPTGLTSSESGPATTGFIDIPTGYTKLYVDYTVSVNPRIRIAEYDSSENSLSTTWEMYSGTPYTRTLSTGATKMKVCVFGYESNEVKCYFV